MNRISRAIAVMLALMTVLLAGMDVFAQSTVTKGNIVRSITVAPNAQGDHILQIQGLFTAEELASVRVRQKANSTKLTLVLPNTLVDPAGIRSNFITFDEGLPLENITVEEGFNEEGNSFQTTLSIQSRSVLRTKVVEPITAGAFNIELVDAEKAAAAESGGPNMFNEKALKSARTRQEEFSAQRKKELEEQKQSAMDKARKEANEIVKSYQKPVVMHVSIINGTGDTKKGYQLSVFLGTHQQKSIEQELGLKMDMVNISNAKKQDVRETTIFYKENYLKPALMLGQKIAGNQRIVPMLDQHERIGVDVEIYLGTDYR